MPGIDAWISALLVPLALWLLISGLDDLLVDLVCLGHWARQRLGLSPAFPYPSDADLAATEERPIAVYIPMWREHTVAGRMLEHNLAAARYPRCEFFVGCYPNDELTIAAVREVASRSAKVHLALCPHDGPTSKADCLNWIYEGMRFDEARRGVRFETVVVHDAEDLIHPSALRWLNYYGRRFDMVQIPVLPLRVKIRSFTHGIYCDEFAEFQSKDVPARRLLGGFLPSNGVGTGYARGALERLAAIDSNRIFEPACLTEDYINGLRLHRLGCSQLFVPIRFQEGVPVATRALFPMDFRSAVRQRARWVIGIALQAWERYGWSGGPAQIYWFWRDRKGLAGNLLTPVVNAVFVYGLATWVWSRAMGLHWGLGKARGAGVLFCATLALQLVRTGVRAGCSARIYGWRFAMGVPVRIVWSNWINCFATVSALRQYAAARLRPRPLGWLKTEHLYPWRPPFADHRPIGEILAGLGLLTREELDAALKAKPASLRLGEYLVRIGRLREEDVCRAVGLQQNVPFEPLRPAEVPKPVARALPARVVRAWRVLPYRIAAGNLYLAGPELPGDELLRELKNYTRLSVHFRLITPGNFDALVREFIEPREKRATDEHR